MLAVGRALVSSPRLLIVDEMSLGLAPVVVERLLPVLRDVADTLGTAVLVVEQHVALAMEVATRAYVLAHGRLTLEGNTADLKNDRALITASYFGDPAAQAELSGIPQAGAEPTKPTHRLRRLPQRSRRITADPHSKQGVRPNPARRAGRATGTAMKE